LNLDAEIFLDSAYLIALAQPTDLFHEKATELAETIQANRIGVTTVGAVLLEVANSLSRLRYRSVAVQLIDSIQRAPGIRVFSLSDETVQQGWKMFRERTDKEWSWVDCISFIVMQHRGLMQALTTDEHFEQAGYVALLRH